MKGFRFNPQRIRHKINAKCYSITSFAHLINLFNNQFSCSRTFEKITSDLYRVVQDPKESLRSYVSFPLDMATAIEAFKM